MGIHHRAAVVGAEARIATAEVADFESGVHRVRFPGQEHHRLPRLYGTAHLDQHAGLAGLHQLEPVQAELALVDQPLDRDVAVIARLYAVDPPLELFPEAGDVPEVLQAGLDAPIGRLRQKSSGCREGSGGPLPDRG
ncbi:hypothetical protein D9M70_517300 [compost metagenome]